MPPLAGSRGSVWRQRGHTPAGRTSDRASTVRVVPLEGVGSSSSSSPSVAPVLAHLPVVCAGLRRTPAPSGEPARVASLSSASDSASLGTSELIPLQLLLRLLLRPGRECDGEGARGDGGGVGSIARRFRPREYSTTRRFDGSLRTTCQSLWSGRGGSGSASRGGADIARWGKGREGNSSDRALCSFRISDSAQAHTGIRARYRQCAIKNIWRPRCGKSNDCIAHAK